MTTFRQIRKERAELEALVPLAQREHRAGRLLEAAAAYRKILAIRPDFAEVHNNLGNILLSQGMLDEAAACCEQAVALKPDFVEAQYSLGNILVTQGKLEEAAARYLHTLALVPDHADAHYNLGNIWLIQGKLEEAMVQFERTLGLKPDSFQAQNNLGNVLRDQGKLDQAAARYQQAIALRPDLADAHYNLGSVFLDLGKRDEATVEFQRALSFSPDFAVAQMYLATCYLVEGDYERGWPMYEGRLRIPGFVPQPRDIPIWMGEPLAGRSLLLVAEPGLGNTIHFVRYARLLKKQGARVVLAAPAALGRLLANHPDLDELFMLGSGEELPRADFYLPLLSAPGAFRTDASSIPCEVPYLWADPELTRKWREELAAIDGFKIGIVWQGSRSYTPDRWRSVPLAHFAPLAALPGVRLVSLQIGFGSEQLATVDFPVLDLSGRLDKEAGSFMDTAAVIQNLDLVVTVDSAIAHLAGALGASVSVALQFSPYWPWLLDRDDTPWYPTMRLFRQTAFHQWPDVFERIAQAVQARRSAGGNTDSLNI